MAEKNLKARIVHKHDTEANWLLATGFTPKQGEIIVYDIDENYTYERFKIGDGVLNVSDLPFADDALRTYIQASIDTASENLKNDLLNGAGEGYDTLKELGDLIDGNYNTLSALVGDTSVSNQIAAATSVQSQRIDAIEAEIDSLEAVTSEEISALFL